MGIQLIGRGEVVRPVSRRAADRFHGAVDFGFGLINSSHLRRSREIRRCCVKSIERAVDCDDRQRIRVCSRECGRRQFECRYLSNPQKNFIADGIGGRNNKFNHVHGTVAALYELLIVFDRGRSGWVPPGRLNCNKWLEPEFRSVMPRMVRPCAIPESYAEATSEMRG